MRWILKSKDTKDTNDKDDCKVTFTFQYMNHRFEHTMQKLTFDIKQMRSS